MSSLPKPVTDYLNKYAGGKWKVELSARFKNIIVVPAAAESKNIPLLLDSLNRCALHNAQQTLILFVINNTRSAPEEIKADNIKTINYLKSLQKNLNLCSIWIDASTPGNEMPDKEGGVGLARKIGMDAALNLFDYHTSGKNILVCLDADCTVSPGYIDGIIESFNKKNIDAASIHFEHPLDNDPENLDAIVCYEIFLRYYVLGLKSAGSYYAFHTVGSAMACTAEAYIKSEGMNKKKAAEDFYFLEKLSKNFQIVDINNAVVYPSARKSWRVPFGTGQRVNRYYENTHNEYLLYSPDSFYVLGEWNRLFFDERAKSGEEYLHSAGLINTGLKDFLILNNFEESINRLIVNSKSAEQLAYQKLRWFDGFKTLKLIHYLRDNVYPTVNMFDALDTLLEICEMDKVKRHDSIPVPPIEIQIEYLEKLRNIHRER